VKYLILSGNLLLRESQFHIVNCLMSFNFKLFFVYTRFLQTTARALYPANETISSGQRSCFVNNETFFRKICWFGRMWHRGRP